MSKPVLNIADAKGFENRYGDSQRFGARLAPMGKALGAKDLGVIYMEVQPGKRAFPFHNHYGNEEMFVILEGSGEYRFGDKKFAINKGDICAAPRGGPETAHQIINSGNSTLKYLSISTMRDPDVVEYPDSQKFAAMALGPQMNIMQAKLKYIGRLESQVDYMDGEEL